MKEEAHASEGQENVAQEAYTSEYGDRGSKTEKGMFDGGAGLSPKNPSQAPDQMSGSVFMNGDADLDDDDGDDDDADYDDADEDDSLDLKHFEHLFSKFAMDPIRVRVHDIIIEGNNQTRDSVIERLLEPVKNVQTTRELLEEAAKANARLDTLGVFDKCIISLELGPVELPGTANVIVNVEELKKPYSFLIRLMNKSETKATMVDGTIMLKNLLGYAERWNVGGSYGWDDTSEVSAGLEYPQFWGLPASLVTRASIFTQDWQKYSSFKEQLLGLSVGLVTEDHHDISYNITWRNMEDPDHTSSRFIHRQLGHALLSSIKYTYKLDKRDSSQRPTRGYAFRSATQLAGIGPNKLLRFVRQELDFRCALPLGFCNSAINFGLSGGLVMPWGEGFCRKVTPISDRFFMGGHSSLVSDMKGPATLLGFRSRGVGPTAMRQTKAAGDEKWDTLGGDIAVTGFLDLSFDLPLKFLRQLNIHGHCFACAGNLIGLTGVDRESFSFNKFWSSFRCSAGVGMVIPTPIFRLEVNICHILRQFEGDRSRRGLQLSISSLH